MNPLTHQLAAQHIRDMHAAAERSRLIHDAKRPNSHSRPTEATTFSLRRRRTCVA